MTTEDTILILNLNPSPDAAFYLGNRSEKTAIAEVLINNKITYLPGIEINPGRDICFRAEPKTNNPQIKILPTESVDPDSLLQKLKTQWQTNHESALEIRHDFNPKDYEVLGISSKYKGNTISLIIYRWLGKNLVHTSLSVNFQNNHNHPSSVSDLTDSLKLLEEMSNLSKQALGEIGLPLPSFSVETTSSKISPPEKR